jgi:hypothetical protein
MDRGGAQPAHHRDHIVFERFGIYMYIAIQYGIDRGNLPRADSNRHCRSRGARTEHRLLRLVVDVGVHDKAFKASPEAMFSSGERFFGSVQRKLRYSDASSSETSEAQQGGESPTLSCILREHTAELRKAQTKRLGVRQRAAARPALRDTTNTVKTVSGEAGVAATSAASETGLGVEETKNPVAPAPWVQKHSPAARAPSPTRDTLTAERQRVGSQGNSARGVPARTSADTAVARKPARCRNELRVQPENESSAPVAGAAQNQNAQLVLELAKRDALIASLQRRCAQLEMDLADDRQMEQLLDGYREKLDTAAEENRTLEEALRIERQNQQALQEKLASYKERLAAWPEKLRAETRALEATHEYQSKEARLRIQRLEAEKHQLQDELQQSWDTVASLRAELASVREENAEAVREETQRMRRDYEQKLLQALKELEEQFDAYRQEATEALGRWQRRCIEMEREHCEMSELLRHYRQKSEALTRSRDALERQLQDQITFASTTIESKEAVIGQLDSEIEALQNRIGELQAQIDDLELGDTPAGSDELAIRAASAPRRTTLTR